MVTHVYIARLLLERRGNILPLGGNIYVYFLGEDLGLFFRYSSGISFRELKNALKIQFFLFEGCGGQNKIFTKIKWGKNIWSACIILVTWVLFEKWQHCI